MVSGRSMIVTAKKSRRFFDLEEEMRMNRNFRSGKLVFYVFLMAAVLPFWSVSALWAQDFPTKPITMIIPSSAGGSADLAARSFVHLSPEVLGQPMIVQAKPGGGGAIGVELIAQAKPDGYTIGMGSSNFSSVMPALEGRSRGPEEMEAVCLINVQSYIYVVQASSPYKTIKDVIAYAKANPDKLAFGNSGAPFRRGPGVAVPRSEGGHEDPDRSLRRRGGGHHRPSWGTYPGGDPAGGGLPSAHQGGEAAPPGRSGGRSAMRGCRTCRP